ncbi:MAG: 2-keto-3-deoxygluconate permease [Methylobacteriaceae bacterium]|jgi:2-keto-3-deoxygluconate permease|nr:2-keto-3-deoxygluconate permease [Methylobacteriaceae bacterium]
MKILASINKIPGGIMVVPLLLGALMNTLFPNAFTSIGGLTAATFSKAAANTVIGVTLVCIGSQISLKASPQILKRGLTLTLAKFLAGFIPAVLVGQLIGPEGLLGITPFMLIAAVTNSNGGLYFGLVSQYGDDIDGGVWAVISINDGPFLTLVGMGLGGLANIPAWALLSTIIPLAVGFILGNLDEDIAKLLKPGGYMLIPFFAFPLGCTLSFQTIVSAGATGILLGVCCVALTMLFCISTDKFILGRPGYAGAALSTTAGNAAATPAVLATADPTLQALVGPTTAAIAASVVVTAILAPIVTTWAVKMWGSPKSPDKALNA